MKDTYRVEELEKRFRDRKNISIDELHRFYKVADPDLKRSTLRWRIYKLINEEVLHRVKRGVYTLEPEKREWKPEITVNLKEIYIAVQDKFPYLKFCVWSTQWLLPYVHHLPARYLTIVDTEKDTEESVFNFISDVTDGPVLVEPSNKEMNAYIDWNMDNIIVRRLISQSPLMETEGIKVPKLEKIIIDLFNEKVVFRTFQGSELKTIYQNLFTNYRINESTLERYALRRNKWEEFKISLKKWKLSDNLTEDL